MFPSGDQLLPEDVEKFLMKQFDEFEEEVIGKGVHQQLKDTLHMLDLKYIKASHTA